MAAFPGAKIDAVRDPGVDAYGLPNQEPEPVALGEPEGPELAPYDSDPAEGRPDSYGDIMEMDQ
jgi:hypothetical protein